MEGADSRFRWFSLLATLLALGVGCSGDSAGPETGASDKKPPTDLSFVDVTETRALRVQHALDPAQGHPLPEIMGPGLAVFDADGDGRADLYCPQASGPNRLWLRQADGSYRASPDARGLADPGYGMGCALGDVDGDGDLDVFVANFGRDALYLNEGPEGFRRTEVDFGSDWTSTAAFLDADGDGDLDLFCVRYLAFDSGPNCERHDGRPDYCSPRAYPATRDRVYLNDGRGVFRPAKTALPGKARHGLGIAVDDFDEDGDDDVYVANDGDPNQLWINVGRGRFEERALVWGLAFNGEGAPEAGMGVALGDADGDGRRDLVLTHLAGESNTYYRRQAGDSFRDVTGAAGLMATSLTGTGFGIALADFDADGHNDLVVAQGRVQAARRPVAGELPPRWAWYGEKNQFLRGQGRGKFSVAPGGDFSAGAEISRALAVFDEDADGDLDIVVTNTAGPLRLYENRMAARGHWVACDVLGPKGPALATGARLRMVVGERSFGARVGAATSYQTACAAPLHFGLGEATRIDRLEITWPNGETDTHTDLAVDRSYRLRPGGVIE